LLGRIENYTTLSIEKYTTLKYYSLCKKKELHREEKGDD
jgi:hypothetical protein